MKSNFNSHTREGVTHRQEWACNPQQDFNSHTREGVTVFFHNWAILLLNFNSHTREGVTLGNLNCKGDLYFNSHTREGVTTSTARWYHTAIFQLTHPWGCDLKHYQSYQVMGNFNSHTREGVTECPMCGHKVKYISTHTPVRVWHRPCYAGTSIELNFNSHTREGVTKSFQWLQENTQFQLTHPWGCDGETVQTL